MRRTLALLLMILPLLAPPGAPGAPALALGAQDDDERAQAEAPETDPADEIELTATADDDNLAQRIAEAALAIRNDRPAHERDEPWSISLAELRMESRPLRMEQLEERVNIWLEILQQKVRERIRLDIASNREEFADIKTQLVRQSGQVQAEVNAVEERVTLLIDMLDDRGGDVSQYRRYVATATGQEIDWLDPDIVVAWLTSPTGGVEIALNILKFLGVLFAFWIAAKIIASIVRGSMGRVAKGKSDMLKRVVATSTKRVIILVGFIVALGQLGMNIGPLIAAIGAAGLVVGFALQGALSNFASGILILVNRPYDVGDVIKAGGVSGKVERMTLVNTTILTFDNQIMYVPNDEIWSGVITNITGLPTRRVDLVFGIGYAEDMAKAERIIEEAVKAHPLTLDEPAPTIKVNELADSSVNFIVRPWSKTSDYWTVYWDLMRTIKERFDEEGVNIPFPQRDLHLPAAVRVVLDRGE